MTRHFLALHDYNEIELVRHADPGPRAEGKAEAGDPAPLAGRQDRGADLRKVLHPHQGLLRGGRLPTGRPGLFISSGTSQMGRGEPIKDTARVMSRYCDGVMIRTFGQEIVEEFAHYSAVPVINGLTDLFHPCQIMADLLTVIEHKGSYEGLKFAWVGDGNNMANTWIEAAAIFGFDLTPGLPAGLRTGCKGPGLGSGQGARQDHADDRPERGGRPAPMSSTPMSGPAWDRRASRRSGKRPLPATVWTMPCWPWPNRTASCCTACRPTAARRSSDSVIEGKNSVVWDEAENRLHIQKAIMATLIK